MTDAPPADYAAARDHMVDGQVRPNKVSDPRIVRAMRTLPRERFLPPGLASLAYVDEDVKLPNGRALMEPMVIARLVQLLRIRDGERGLVVGSGSGYGAAIVASCGAKVVALEEDAGLLALARAVLPTLAPGVRLTEGRLAEGWATEAPYDFILIEGAVDTIPAVFATQLAPAGRLSTVIAGPGRPGHGVLAELVHVGAGHQLRAQPFFDCATPALPQFRPAPAFTF